MALRNIFAVISISYKEGLRQRVLYGVLIFALLMIGSAVMISGLFMREIGKITADFLFGAITLGGLLVPFFLAVNLLARDIEKRSIITILSRQITRGQYILGKFGGLALLNVTIVLLLSLAGTIAMWASYSLYGSQFFQSLNVSALLTAVFFTLVGQLVLTAMVVLWSCITNSSFLVTLLTIATYIIGQSVDELVQFIASPPQGVVISATVKISLKAALYIFPNLSAFNIKLAAAHGLGIPLNEALWLATYGISYITAVLALSVVFFSKRDLL
jgi:ABC-type transport system involved in multi-copper enzyme maturation permease subunit